MRIILNGKDYNINKGISLNLLLKEVNAIPENVATVVNGAIVKKNERESFILSENDKVEILIFAGGG